MGLHLSHENKHVLIISCEIVSIWHPISTILLSISDSDLCHTSAPWPQQRRDAPRSSPCTLKAAPTSRARGTPPGRREFTTARHWTVSIAELVPLVSTIVSSTTQLVLMFVAFFLFSSNRFRTFIQTCF